MFLTVVIHHIDLRIDILVQSMKMLYKTVLSRPHSMQPFTVLDPNSQIGHPLPYTVPTNISDVGLHVLRWASTTPYAHIPITQTAMALNIIMDPFS